jgi:hypothetical protein
MLKIDVDYYKGLFWFEEKISINLAGDFWQSDQEVSEEQNLMLDANFTKQEVKDAVLALILKEHLDLMIFSFIFYQHF